MSDSPFRSLPTPPSSVGPCPRCPGISLEPRTSGRIAVWRCRQCCGLWLDGADMLSLIHARSADLERLARADDRPAGEIDAPAPCPRCAAVMATERGASGVALDVCRQHGLWFDAGELAAFLDFVDHGLADHPRHADLRLGLVDRLVAWLSRGS